MLLAYTGSMGDVKHRDAPMTPATSDEACGLDNPTPGLSRNRSLAFVDVASLLLACTGSMGDVTRRDRGCSQP